MFHAAVEKSQQLVDRIFSGKEWQGEATNFFQIIFFLNKSCNYFDTIEGEAALQYMKNYISQYSQWFSITGAEMYTLLETIQTISILGDIAELVIYIPMYKDVGLTYTWYYTAGKSLKLLFQAYVEDWQTLFTNDVWAIIETIRFVWNKFLGLFY